MTFPVGAWFQPPENFLAWKARGCNYVLGPELGNPPRLGGEAWASLAAQIGMQAVGNFDTRVPNLMAWFIPLDEPNRLGTPIAQLAAYVDKFTRLDPSLPIVLSLAGDKITSAGAKDIALYQSYAGLSPRLIAAINWYGINREPARYGPTIANLNGEAQARWGKWTGLPSWAVLECSWQKLNASPTGREPTAAEVNLQWQQSRAGGASGLVWFATATGTAGPKMDWPMRYDPPVAPELTARMTAIAAGLNPFLEARVGALEARVAKLESRLDAMIKAGA